MLEASQINITSELQQLLQERAWNIAKITGNTKWIQC